MVWSLCKPVHTLIENWRWCLVVRVVKFRHCYFIISLPLHIPQQNWKAVEIKHLLVLDHFGWENQNRSSDSHATVRISDSLPPHCIAGLSVYLSQSSVRCKCVRSQTWRAYFSLPDGVLTFPHHNRQLTNCIEPTGMRHTAQMSTTNFQHTPVSNQRYQIWVQSWTLIMRCSGHTVHSV
jgi:hypothetical protein